VIPLEKARHLIQAIMDLEDEVMVTKFEALLSNKSDTELLEKALPLKHDLNQLIELLEKGYEVFGQEKFQIWMRTQNKVLKSKPIDMLNTSEGIQQVEDILGRIEHGVYS